MQFKHLFLYFISLCISVYGGNILAILPSPSYSHQIAFRDIWRELSLRGHQVTLVTTNPINDPSLKNLTEIDVSFSYDSIEGLIRELQASMNMWNSYYSVQRMMDLIIEEQLSNPKIKALVDKSNHFDVIMLEFIYPELLALAEIYQCPTIFFSTTDMSELYHQFVGNPSHPAVNADLMVPFFGKLTFFDRVVNTIFTLHTYYTFKFHIFPKKEQLVKKYFNTIKPIEEMIKDVDLMFVNSNPIIQSVRAVGPATISVGGGRHFGSDEKLPKLQSNAIRSMSYKFISVVLFVASSCSLSSCENILAILPTPSYSHQIAYRHIWKELSLRGHQITLLTTDPLNDPGLTNLTEIDVKFCYESVHKWLKVVDTMNLLNANEITLNVMLDMAEKQLTYAPVQNLIRSDKRFDLVMVEFFYSEYLAFAEIFQCPKILFSSTDLHEVYHKMVGNPSHPALNPDILTPFFGKLTIKERITSAMFEWYSQYYFRFNILPQKEKLIEKYLNISVSLEKLIRDVDLLFLNTNPIFQTVRAVGPNTINISGRRQTVSAGSLPNDLAQFLDNAKGGFIYFSLGSNVKSKDLSEDSLQAIIQTLRDLPYKVLWKFEADSLPGKPDNVKLIKWAPQQQILSHPNIKLFITQGGLQSMEEAIYSDVAFVVIPFFGDQEQNARIMETKGIAKIVQRVPSIDKNELKDAILEVLNNPSYRENVKRLRQLALDTPMTGLEKAVWWTEYVIRNKGARHLRNPAADLPVYQYYLLDVLGFLLGVITLVLVVLFIVTRTLYRLLLRVLRKPQSQHKKSD